MKIRVLSAVLICTVLSLPVTAKEMIGTVSVIDGDTLRMRDITIRLYGIDAPEKKQFCRRSNGTSYPCGRVSATRLFQRVQGKAVRCKAKSETRHEFVIAECLVDKVNLNDGLVRDGLALADRASSREYIASEDLAKTDGIGIWRGEFDNPREWKKIHDTKMGNLRGPETGKSPVKTGKVVVKTNGPVIEPENSSAGTVTVSDGIIKMTKLQNANMNTRVCAQKTSCDVITSCADARLRLALCGDAHLDPDRDGTPCESLCQ